MRWVPSAGVLFLALFHTVFGRKNITIVALFDSEEEVMEQIFRDAIQRINIDRWTFSKINLIPQIEHIRKDDSFQASKRVCSNLQLGIGGVFGPQSVMTSSHIQTICNRVHVPHVEIRWDFRTFKDNLSVNLSPHPKSLSQAYVDIVRWWDWKHAFTIIYEDNEGLARLQGLLKEAGNHEIVVRQLGPGNDYRPLLKEIRRSRARHIVLDCSFEKIQPVLKQANQIGLINDYYDFFITNLDIHTLDLSSFVDAMTNITGIRLVNVNDSAVHAIISDWRYAESQGKKLGFSQNELKTESALMYDAVHVFAKALVNLDYTQKLDIRPLSCNREAAWFQGSKLVEEMKKIDKPGLTGFIRFNKQGFRTDFHLDIIRMNPAVKWKKLAEWSLKTKVINTISESDLKLVTLATRFNRTLIISTIFSEPYFMNKSNSDKLEGIDRYEGYVVDLMELVSKETNMSYEFVPVKDNSYGRLHKGKWDGIIGELYYKKADAAIGDVTITRERETAVDFTVPFMELGIAILYKKPVKQPPDLLSFLSPFKTEVWIYMATAYLGVSVVMFVICRLSPYEWNKSHPCDTEPQELENTFSEFNNPIWFNIGSLMQQGSDLAPKAISGRTLASIWWFFTLIMISSYTANLAAFLTQERMGETISGAEDLVKQHRVKYGCLEKGSTRAFFEQSNVDIFKKMWSFMQSEPSVFTKSNLEGVQRVKKGDYAFLMESVSIEYKTERECELMKVGQHLDNKGYGIATRKGSPYWNDFNRAVLKLQENTALTKLKQKWWKEQGGGKCDGDSLKKISASSSALQLANVGGVFVVLMFGTGVGVVIGIMEFVWNIKKNVNEKQTTFKEELMKEIKFVFSGKSSKPVSKSPGQSENITLKSFTGAQSLL